MRSICIRVQFLLETDISTAALVMNKIWPEFKTLIHYNAPVQFGRNLRERVAGCQTIYPTHSLTLSSGEHFP